MQPVIVVTSPRNPGLSPVSVLRALTNRVLHKLQCALEVAGVCGLTYSECWVRTTIPGSVNERRPAWIERCLCPRGSRPLRARTPCDEVVQHSAVAQDDVALVESISVHLWIFENLLAPVADCRADFLTQRTDRHRLNQRSWTRPGERNAVLPDDRPDDERIA